MSLRKVISSIDIIYWMEKIDINLQVGNWVDEWRGYINLQVRMDREDKKTAGWDRWRGYINLQVGMDREDK